MIRISRNNDLKIIHDLMFDVNIVTVIGNSSAISTSKIMKIIVIKKNRDENGSRAEFFWSNPHSNEDLFSRSSLIFFEINVVNIIMSGYNKMVTIAVVIIIITIYLVFTNFLIGSQVHFSLININHY
jgi:hypothetical protein